MPSLLLALAVLLFPLPSSQSAECADVHVVGIRGSGQSGYGEQVGSVLDAIEDRVEAVGLSMSDEPLDYPAISISDSFGLALVTGAYGRSVSEGAAELLSVMDDVAASCPSTFVVIVGYSQGAHVIKAAFDDATPHRIAAVVMLADPTRDPAQAGVRRLGSPPAEASGAFGQIAFADQVRPLSIDVCAIDDIVCDRSRGGFLAHVEGYEEHAADVASMVIAMIERQPERGQSPR